MKSWFGQPIKKTLYTSLRAEPTPELKSTKPVSDRAKGGDSVMTLFLGVGS